MFELKYKEIGLGNIVSEITVLFKNSDDLSHYINHGYQNWLSWEVCYK